MSTCTSVGVGNPLKDIPHMTTHYCDLVVLWTLFSFLLLLKILYFTFHDFALLNTPSLYRCKIGLSKREHYLLFCESWSRKWNFDICDLWFNIFFYWWLVPETPPSTTLIQGTYIVSFCFPTITFALTLRSLITLTVWDCRNVATYKKRGIISTG